MLMDKVPEAFSDHSFVYETLTEAVMSSVMTVPLAGLKTAEEVTSTILPSE